MKIKRRFRLQEKDFLPTAFLILAGGFIILILCYLKLLFDYQTIAANSKSVYVQTDGGESLLARKKNLYFRTEESIQSFVRDWVKLQYTFSGNILDKEGKIVPDLGVELEIDRRNFKIPTNAFNASFALPPEIQKSFLAVLATEWVDNSYFSSSNDKIVTEFIIDEMGLPKAYEKQKHTWEVPLIAKVIYRGDGSQNIRYYRKVISVKAINVPNSSPLPNASVYEFLTYEWQKKGLQIIGIKNL